MNEKNLHDEHQLLLYFALLILRKQLLISLNALENAEKVS